MDDLVLKLVEKECKTIVINFKKFKGKEGYNRWWVWNFKRKMEILREI